MPQDPNTMCRWRSWSPADRELMLQERARRQHPPHSPPHVVSDTTTYYMITAACFEHRPVIGSLTARMAQFAMDLADVVAKESNQCFAWVVLPNHYHVLVNVDNILHLLHAIGQFHGRTSYDWNGIDMCRGRQVWCKSSETVMKSEGHFFASINYVLHNPVHHGYCRRWTQWPFSSASDYLRLVGRELAENRWRSYPLYDYGREWDPAEL